MPRNNRLGDRSPRDERGSTIPMIIGFAIVLILLVGVVTDVSAAYLRRQSLDTLADGAALQGADLGASGTEVYAGGLPAEGRLRLTAASVRRSVQAYLRDVGAYRRYPGLRLRSVRVDADRRRVEVGLGAPVHLPFTVPGVLDHPMIGSTGSASVTVDK